MLGKKYCEYEQRRSKNTKLSLQQYIIQRKLLSVTSVVSLIAGKVKQSRTEF